MIAARRAARASRHVQRVREAIVTGTAAPIADDVRTCPACGFPLLRGAYTVWRRRVYVATCLACRETRIVGDGIAPYDAIDVAAVLSTPIA